MEESAKGEGFLGERGDVAADLERGGAGVRAQAVAPDGSLVDDFKISVTAGAVHVVNAPSPGATASLAIGRHVAGVAAETFGLVASA